MKKKLKAMKQKAASKIAKGKLGKVAVFRGHKEKTGWGLTKKDLMTNTKGKVVTKKQSEAHRKNWDNGKYVRCKSWALAVQKARKALGLKGFVAVKKGSSLYNKAQELRNIDE